MKKLLLIAVSFFVLYSVQAQFTIQQNLGSKATLISVKGGLRADSVLIPASFADTTTANTFPVVKYYPGNIIRTVDDIWMRNYNATAWVKISFGGASGTGTVTDFSAGDLSPLFTTSEATTTTTPALTFSLNTQNANKVFAGPTTGADAAPTFRLLVADDIPDLSTIYLTNITGLVTAGTNVTVTGTGTSGDPYVINSSGGGGSNIATASLTATGDWLQNWDNRNFFFDSVDNYDVNSGILNSTVQFSKLGGKSLAAGYAIYTQADNTNWSTIDITNYTVGAGGSSVYMGAENGGRYSEFFVKGQGFFINPHLGNIVIDTLLNLSTQNVLMGWTTTAGGDRGEVGYITAGTGITISAGVISNSGVVSELDPSALKIVNNLSDLANAGTARTNLGATTVGGNIFTATNPSAVRWIRVNADNTITFRTAVETASDIGALTSTDAWLLSGTSQQLTGNVTIDRNSSEFKMKTGASDYNIWIKANEYKFGSLGGTNDYLSIDGISHDFTLVLNGAGNFGINSSGDVTAGTWTADPITAAYGGVPSGGTTGQVLKKTSNTNYDYAWAADATGGGGSFSTLSDVSLTSVAQGDVLYYNGSAWVNLAAGTSGQFLKTNGTGANPSWDAPSGSGDMILASVQSVTGLKTFDKDKLAMKGTSTGVTTISTANTSATNYTATLQAATGTIAYLADITGTNSGTNTGDQTTSGTTNRITVTNGSTNPVIDIAATYVGQTSITTVGTIGTGTWQGSVISSTYGGTGVNNGGRTFTLNTNNFTIVSSNQANTLTLANNLTTAGNFALTLTQTGTTNVTLPTSGTLQNAADVANVERQVGVNIVSPTASEQILLFQAPSGGATAVRGVVTLRGSSPSVTMKISYGSTYGTEVGTVVASVVVNSTGATTLTINTSSIPANNYVWLVTTATSGTVDEFNPHLTYHY